MQDVKKPIWSIQNQDKNTELVCFISLLDLTGKKKFWGSKRNSKLPNSCYWNFRAKVKFCRTQILFLPLIPAETALKSLQTPLQAQLTLPQHLCYYLHNVYYDEYQLGNTVNIYANNCTCKKTDKGCSSHSILLCFTTVTYELA